jgi:hypothetical protein
MNVNVKWRNCIGESCLKTTFSRYGAWRESGAAQAPETRRERTARSRRKAGEARVCTIREGCAIEAAMASMDDGGRAAEAME